MSDESGRLANFPVSFFSVVMGIAGLAIAWGEAARAFGVSPAWHHGIAAAAMGVFLVLATMYSAKWMVFPAVARAELAHPVKLSFVPTISIGLLLLAVCFVAVLPGLSKWLWFVGAVMQLFLTLFVVRAWVVHEHFEVQHMNPAWFIPAVGNIIVPIVGVKYAGAETAWFFFSVGIVFWVVLMTMVFYRMFFHNPLPDVLAPTLFILLAPPAVGFVSYMKIVGQLDGFAHVLYYMALFLLMLLLTMLPRFARLKFTLSWWAYSFPMAAMTAATLVMWRETGAAGFRYLGMALLVLTTVLIAWLAVRTVTAASRKEICQPEKG